MADDEEDPQAKPRRARSAKADVPPVSHRPEARPRWWLALAASMQEFAKQETREHAQRNLERLRKWDKEESWAKKDRLVVQWVKDDVKAERDPTELLDFDEIRDQVHTHEERLRSTVVGAGAVKAHSRDFLEDLHDARGTGGRLGRSIESVVPAAVRIRLGLEYDRVRMAGSVTDARNQLTHCMLRDLDINYGADLTIATANSDGQPGAGDSEPVVLSKEIAGQLREWSDGVKKHLSKSGRCVDLIIEPVKSEMKITAEGGERVVFSKGDVDRLLTWWKDFKKRYSTSDQWKLIEPKLKQYLRLR